MRNVFPVSTRKPKAMLRNVVEIVYTYCVSYQTTYTKLSDNLLHKRGAYNFSLQLKASLWLSSQSRHIVRQFRKNYQTIYSKAYGIIYSLPIVTRAPRKI